MERSPGASLPYQGHFTLTGSRPDVDAHRLSWERRVLQTLVSRPHRSAAVLPSHLRAGYKRSENAPCRATLRFDRTGFARANRFRGVKRPCRRAARGRRRAPRRATIRTRRRRVIHGRIQSVGVPYPGLAGAHDRSLGVSLTSRRSANASPRSGASWRTPRSGETRSGRSASGASGPVSNAPSGSSSGPMRRSPTPPSCSTSRPRTATRTPRGRSRRTWTASIPRSDGSSSGACSPGPWTAATPSWR